MKDTYLILSLILLAGTMIACEPVVTHYSMGGIIPADQLKLTVKATTEGGNQIVLANETPRCAGWWDYGIGIARSDRDTIIIPYMGTHTITFKGMCDGGIVTTTRTVAVSKIDHAASPEWTMLAGSGTEGKTWTWEDDDDYYLDNISSDYQGAYGTGGYGNDYCSTWSGADAGGSVSGIDVPTDEEMVFDLNGGPNFTLRRTDGTVLQKGTFKFDMSATTALSNGSLWAIGQITFTGASIMLPYGCDMSPSDTIHTFDIITISEDRMVLAYSAAGTPLEAWETAYFWCFKAK